MIKKVFNSILDVKIFIVLISIQESKRQTS